MLELELNYNQDYTYTHSFWLNPQSEVMFLAKDDNKWVQVRQKGQETRDYSLTSFVANYGFSYELYLADLAYENARNRTPLTFPNLETVDLNRAA